MIPLMKYYLCILSNENSDDHLNWVKACESRNDVVEFDIIDLTRNDWFERINDREYDCYLCRPPDKTSHFKQLYDERIYIINKVVGKLIYPSFEEMFIYENKKLLSYWLKANNIPHPKTDIFYNKDQAMNFARKCSLPIVAKTSIGSSGSGVEIIRNRNALYSYINRAFSKKGIRRQWGVNLRKDDLSKRGAAVLSDFRSFYNKIKRRFIAAKSDPHRWYVIFQEFIKCDFEWRAVKIGESYFAHKKLKTTGDKFSGTALAGWDGPSKELLNFVKYVCDKRGFYSQAVDIFEPAKGIFLVNELQCFFGSKNPHQMILDGIPGRYVLEREEWVFEPGTFNTNNSYDLRLNHLLSILENIHVMGLKEE